MYELPGINLRLAHRDRVLFNSYHFLFFFLPVVLAGSFVLARRAARAAAWWLVVASLVFYGWWDYRYLVLLIGSVCFNHLVGNAIARRGGRGMPATRALLALGVVANLSLLCYFKYAGFLVANISALLAIPTTIPAIALPLGISFFTFTQIAYLVDIYREPVRYDFVPYALFVTYFPHLIAGPILHHRDMVPQFVAPGSFRADSGAIAAGVTILAIGLFKKVVLADQIAPYATPVFDAAARGDAPNTIEAWGAALAFGLQLYFDFSGYSDMAIGLSKMLGVRMPANFDSPYRATSLIEFWRRWHLTLSSFLRDYVYIALGGSRRGPLRRYMNLLATMFLGGLWHGAGWTFIVWGGAHGALLALNHAWRALRAGLPRGPAWLAGLERGTGAVLTFVAVFCLWVLFRAADLSAAMLIMRGMAGLNGTVVPPSWLVATGELARWALQQNVHGGSLGADLLARLGSVDVGLHWIAERGGSVLLGATQLAWTASLLAIVWFAPNTTTIMARANAVLLDRRVRLQPTTFAWSPSGAWALATTGLLAASLVGMTRISEFLYFQF